MIRKNYLKLMKVLINYCRHPKAKPNAIIDLCRGYRNHSFIDMAPARLFFLYEIPYSFPLERAKELILSVLHRMTLPHAQHQTINSYDLNNQCFDMIFMPIVTRYTDNELLFRELFDVKVLKEFMETFFRVVRISQNPHVALIDPSAAIQTEDCRIEEIRLALENSIYFSSEQFLIDVAKVLNLIFRYFDLSVIEEACPQKELSKVNQFLYNCAKNSKSPLLIEWAFYSVTSMFIRILNTPTGQMPDRYMQMIEQTSEMILTMILQHSQNLTFKALVHKSLRNLIQVIESINHQKQQIALRNGQEQRKIQSVPFYLKEALTYEGRNNQSLIYLSSFILANEDSIYRYDQSLKFIQRISKTIFRFGAQNVQSLSVKQLVIELSSVLIVWSFRRYQEFRQNQTNQEAMAIYYNTAQNIIFYLGRLALMVQHSPSEPLKESLELVQLSLKQIKSLIQLFHAIKPQFPFFQKLIQQNSESMSLGPMESDMIQLQKIIMLNFFYILAKHSSAARNDSIIFMLEQLVVVSNRFPKGILFSCRILGEILYGRQPIEGDYLKRVNDNIRNLIEDDLRKSSDKNAEEMMRAIKAIEDRYIREHKPVQLAFQEQACALSSMIPHFAIRAIEYLDREEARTGLQTKNITFTEGEFGFYKNLSCQLLKIISCFRKHLYFDQGEMAPAKCKIKHNILHMANNHETQYTQNELVTLNDDIIDVKVDDTNFDMFNKESVLLGLQLVVKKMKKMPPQETIQILESVTNSIHFLLRFDNNEYIIEQLRKVIDVLVLDQEDDLTKFLPERKADYIKAMLSKIGELQSVTERKDNQQTLQLIEKIFEQGIRFLESQSSIAHEYSIRLFEKLFIHSKGKSVKLKQRLFAVFERFNGPSIFKKLQFFFNKHFFDSEDKLDKLSFFAAQSQFLDFTLYSFKATNMPLRKLQYSSKLFPLFNPDVSIANLIISDDGDIQMNGQDSEYSQIKSQLQPFTDQYGKFKNKKLASLLNCLSEVISMNPNYSHEKLIADKLFTFLFPQYWNNLLSREEQQYLAEGINKYFLSSIQQLSLGNNVAANLPDIRKYSFPKVFLEALAATSPQVRLEPEMLQLMGKNFNMWHVAIPIIENQITLFPENERYFFALSELYEKLSETDYIAGLRRNMTQSAETRSMVSYAQHDMWEEINQQFSHFIIYYAEQEGQYQYMDNEQNKPGKYQRQLPEPFYNSLIKHHEKHILLKYEQLKQQNPDTFTIDQATFVQQETDKMNRELEACTGKQKFDASPAIYEYPRKGPNNRVKEMDLRVWDTLFIESLKVLNKWDQYHDITKALQVNVEIPNIEMMIEYAWNTKNWQLLNQYENILRRSDNLKHRMYYIYLTIKGQQIQFFDEAFKAVMTMASNKWDVQLPKYVDNVHFDNLILYQLIMEGSEGGRNMIKEAQNARQRGRFVELKTAVNIWRERIPNMCESIQMWKEVLYNRNFIQDQICQLMSPQQPLPPPPQGATEQEIQALQKKHFEQQYSSRQQFSNEFLDKAWNYYKLTQVCRKQGLPNLALSYLLDLTQQLSFTYESDGTRYERFKFDYEYIKLQLEYNTNADALNRFMNDYAQLVENKYQRPYRELLAYQKSLNSPQNSSGQPPLQQPVGLVFEPQQISELLRLIGDYFFKIGQLDKSQKYLKESISLNKKEYKTWLSYAKLNLNVFQIKKDEVSLQNVLKSYFSAITLCLHKSRFIVPQILNLIKKKRELNSPEFREITGTPQAQGSIKKNLDQMPTWIWLFWIPQVLQMAFTHNNQVEREFSRTIIDKISRLYPQSIYQSLKTRQELLRLGPVNNLPPEEQQMLQQNNNFAQACLNNIRRTSYSQVLILDRFSSEFIKSLKSSSEEELHLVLGKILCMSQFFKIDQFEKDFNKFLLQLHTKFFNQQTTQTSPVLAELQASFERDFLNPDTCQNDIIEIIKRLKNLKDFLYKQISLTEQKSYLELISPLLANFNDKGVELPGQFALGELEPVPQNTIYVQKFDNQVVKGSGASKRISIRCSNQRQYAFVTSHLLQIKEEYNKFCSEERLNQVKLLMNMIFRKHKETLRRGVKFYVPIKALLYRCKMVQDDLQFQSLQEIHDFLFQERGMDPDQALNLQIKKVEEILELQKSQPQTGSPQLRTLSSISNETKQKINEETFEEMKNIYCKPYLLSSFFHRIFYNVDELFIFKKYFTTYHAANSFFQYVFQQVEFATLSQLSVCKTTGQLAFSDAKLIEFLKNKNVKRQIQNQYQTIDFEAVEKEDIIAQNYLPFRLSGNLVEFIGRSGGGLTGLFAGVMTACSLAMAKHHDKLLPLLTLVYRDDLNDDRENAIFFINSCVDYMKYKMLSLASNKEVLNIEHFLDDPDYVQWHLQQKQAQEAAQNQSRSPEEEALYQAKLQQEQYVKFGQYRIPREYLKYEVERPNILEEFNKKVFDLIDIAMDEKRLSQMPSNWNAWF